MKTISILGGGWLGIATAIAFKKDYKVKISSRTEEKIPEYEKDGFTSYVLNEENLEHLDELLSTDVLFINFPPSKFNNYVEFLEKIYNNEKIKNIENIIFISSTSIYPNEDGIFTEETIIKNPVSTKVYGAEELVKSKTNVIFRCSGLMGYNRIAGKYFSNKEIDSGKVKVNHIHRDDVISATKFVIDNNINGVFNLCSKEHPSRKDLYLQNSEKLGFDKPIFIEDKKYKDRIIDGSKIENFGFKYKYSNPLTF